MSHTIAFGDDHSPGADGAWEWISGHSWDGWALEVVTADPPEDMHPVEPAEAELHPCEPEKPRDAAELGFDSVAALCAEVDPRVALISKPWDLVVIGPRGIGALKHLHLGSTADWLIRQPVTPLVIAREGGPVRRVLVASDGSDHVRRAVRTLASLPWLDGVAVHVVTVSERRFDTDHALHVVAEGLAGSGADIVDTATREGRPTHVIASEIEAVDADLIVMGARGHGKIRRLVLGSTAAAIAGSVDRSILVAHSMGEEGSGSAE